MRIGSVADRPAVHSPMTPTGCGQAAHAPRMRRATCLPRDACNSYSPDGLERLVLGRRHVRPTGVLSTAAGLADTKTCRRCADYVVVMERGSKNFPRFEDVGRNFQNSH